MLDAHSFDKPYSHLEEDSRLPLGDSILASWIRSICQTVRGYGLDPGELMVKAGLDVAMLTVPDARYPAMNVRRFWEIIVAATRDDLVGMRCGHEMQVATLHGLGLAIVTSHSLAQVLELIARYCKVISSTMEMSLAHDKHGTTLAIGTLHGSEARHAARLAVLAFVLRQANSLSQHLVQPIAVHLRMSKLSDEDRSRLNHHFGCEVDTTGDAPDSIRFAYADVMEPYAGSNAMLREANEQVVRAYINRVRQSSFTARVEEEIQMIIEQGGTAKIESVAKKLNLSARTLQRRLEDEKVTFAELFDGRRRQLAHDSLAHSEMSITEIAYTIGFADPSNFSRSCVRWFGVSPASYRRRIRGVQT